MKRKILLTILITIFTLLISVGGAVWLVPETTLQIVEQFGVPTQRTSPEIEVEFPDIYYGQDVDAKTSSSVDGSWTYSLKTSQLTAQGTTSSPDGTVVCDQTITATFTPTNRLLYKPKEETVSVYMMVVAQYGDNYYTTIDQALSVANTANSGTVYSLPLEYTEDAKAKTAKTITSAITQINSGVTLAVPYASDAMDTTLSYVTMATSGTGTYRVCSYGNTTYLKNQIYIAAGHSLSNKGTINVSGEVCGGAGGNYAVGKDYASSVTAGRHGQINLGKDAILTNTGTINCYGFISETKTNNGSQVIMDSGTATVVFSVGEHRGGSMYFGMIDPANATVADEIASAAVSGLGSTPGQYTPDTLQCPPFLRFYIASIGAKTTVKYNATLTGLANLAADGENNVTTVNLINNSNALITLTSSSSYVETKYDPSTHNTDLDIYGNMTLSPMSLSLQVTKSMSSITTTIEITLTTGAVGESEGIFFPICDYFDISLNAINGSATVDTTGQKIKLLPGAKLTIGEGVTVNAKSIAVYNNNSLFLNGHDKHYTTSTPAELIVNGTLNTVDLGGTVKSDNDNAILNITGDNHTLSQEIKSTVTGQSAAITVTFVTMNMGYTGVNYFTVKETTLTANGNTISLDGAVLPMGTYNVKDGKWYSRTKIISYNTNGGTFSSAPSNKSYTVDGGYTITSDDIPTTAPTREHYTFAGWTLNGASPVGQVTYVNAELIAEWTPINYNITYDMNTDNIDTSNITTTPTNSNYTTYNGDSIIPLVEPEWEDFVFDGWYLDAELKQKVTVLNGSNILEGVTGSNPITLYGAWYPKGTETYEITYVINNTDEGITAPSTEKVLSTEEKLNNYSPPTFDTQNNTATYPKYFVGWYVDSEFLTPFDKETHLTDDITLYAKWSNKYHFILNGTQGSSTAQTVTGAEAYFTPAQIGSGLNLSTYLGSIETTVSADNNTISVSSYFAGWATTNTTDATKKVTTLTTSHFTATEDGILTCNLYAIWADKIIVTISKGSYVNSYSVTVAGSTVTATTFYVLSGTSITVTASGGDGFTQDITITESYGGNSKSGSSSWWSSASATLTFSAAGDTTISITGS